MLGRRLSHNGHPEVERCWKQSVYAKYSMPQKIHLGSLQNQGPGIPRSMNVRNIVSCLTYLQNRAHHVETSPSRKGGGLAAFKLSDEMELLKFMA